MLIYNSPFHEVSSVTNPCSLHGLIPIICTHFLPYIVYTNSSYSLRGTPVCNWTHPVPVPANNGSGGRCWQSSWGDLPLTETWTRLTRTSSVVQPDVLRKLAITVFYRITSRVHRELLNCDCDGWRFQNWGGVCLGDVVLLRASAGSSMRQEMRLLSPIEADLLNWSRANRD